MDKQVKDEKKSQTEGYLDVIRDMGREQREEKPTNRELGVPGGIDPDKVAAYTPVIWADENLEYLGWNKTHSHPYILLDRKKDKHLMVHSCRLADDVSVPENWRLKDDA